MAFAGGPPDHPRPPLRQVADHVDRCPDIGGGQQVEDLVGHGDHAFREVGGGPEVLDVHGDGDGGGHQASLCTAVRQSQKRRIATAASSTRTTSVGTL